MRPPGRCSAESGSKMGAAGGTAQAPLDRSSPRSAVVRRRSSLQDLLSYLPLLDQKLGAPDQAAPLAGWELPEAFHALRLLMGARADRLGRQDHMQVLRLLETFDLHEVQGAVDYALALGVIGFDAVKHLVLYLAEQHPPKLDLDVYPYLTRTTVGTSGTVGAAGGQLPVATRPIPLPVGHPCGTIGSSIVANPCVCAESVTRARASTDYEAPRLAHL